MLGAVFFAAMTAVSLPSAWRSRSSTIRWRRLELAASGVVFVVYLVWVELFVVDAICLWCTAVHVLAIALVAVVALATAVGTP